MQHTVTKELPLNYSYLNMNCSLYCIKLVFYIEMHKANIIMCEVTGLSSLPNDCTYC